MRYVIMIINCTKKLQDELGIKPELVEVHNPLFSWHANLIKINRRKTLVLVNDVARYNIVLYGLKAKDFKNIKKLIYDEIYKTFENDCINRDIISTYLEEAGGITFSKTQNRTQVARMNKGCEAVDIYSESIKEGSISQIKISKQVNNYPLFDYCGEYKYPNEVLYNELEKRYNKPAVFCKAVKLKMKLDFEKVDISRTVVVPLNYTFREFHRAM